MLISLGYPLMHTPTPWIVSDHAGRAARGWIKSVCKGFPERMVAQALGQETVEERESNAAFIVKAVNNHQKLVEALIEAEKQIEYLHEKFKPTGSGANVLAKIDIALTAAGAFPRG